MGTPLSLFLYKLVNMDEASKSYMDNIDHRDLCSSTIPWANEFDIGEEVELSKYLI